MRAEDTDSAAVRPSREREFWDRERERRADSDHSKQSMRIGVPPGPDKRPLMGLPEQRTLGDGGDLAQRRLLWRRSQAGTIGVLRVGILARTDLSIFRFSWTRSYGVKASHWRSEMSANLSVLHSSRNWSFVVPVFSM